jgi:hypothetical protein
MNGPVDIASINVSGDAVLRLRMEERNGRLVLDLRRLETFAGPAKALTASKAGIAVAIEDLGELVEALKAAELAARTYRIGGDL